MSGFLNRLLALYAERPSRERLLIAVAGSSLILSLELEPLRVLNAEGGDLRLVERMRQLSPRKFEGMLRPAFEEDEWILIAVGAGLGLAVGARVGIAVVEMGTRATSSNRTSTMHGSGAHRERFGCP